MKRFQVLVSLMLSSQTKDQVTHAAVAKLREHGLSVENIIKTDEDVVAKLIHPVGFWKVILFQQIESSCSYSNSNI